MLRHSEVPLKLKTLDDILGRAKNKEEKGLDLELSKQNDQL